MFYICSPIIKNSLYKNLFGVLLSYIYIYIRAHTHTHIFWTVFFKKLELILFSPCFSYYFCRTCARKRIQSVICWSYIHFKSWFKRISFILYFLCFLLLRNINLYFFFYLDLQTARSRERHGGGVLALKLFIKLLYAHRL